MTGEKNNSETDGVKAETAAARQTSVPIDFGKIPDGGEKLSWKGGTMVYPVPAVLVSCGTEESGYNMITVAWTGTVCTDPPMCYISVRPGRYSYDLIKESGEFVINLTTREMAKATDWCGVRSGRDYDKFASTGLTPIPAEKVSAPLIAQSPMSLECRVTEVKELGTHHMFLAEILCVRADERFYDELSGSFSMEKAGLISWNHGKYYGPGSPLGKFGYSVRKKKERWKKKR